MNQNVTSYIPKAARDQVLQLLNDDRLQVVIKKARKRVTETTQNAVMDIIRLQ